MVILKRGIKGSISAPVGCAEESCPPVALGG